MMTREHCLSEITRVSPVVLSLSFPPQPPKPRRRRWQFSSFSFPCLPAFDSSLLTSLSCVVDVVVVVACPAVNYSIRIMPSDLLIFASLPSSPSLPPLTRLPLFFSRGREESAWLRGLRRRGKKRRGETAGTDVVVVAAAVACNPKPTTDTQHTRTH